VPYVKRAFVTNLGYATETTRELLQQDLEDLVHLIACVMYWYKIDPKQKAEWIQTFRSRHKMAGELMKIVAQYKTFASAQEMMREWTAAETLWKK
jgi:hypothetical protein